jgi:hypothetical protein
VENVFELICQISVTAKFKGLRKTVKNLRNWIPESPGYSAGNSQFIATLSYKC